MLHISDHIKLIGSTELRTEIPKLTKDVQVQTVIVTKRGKPVAVLQNYAQYKEKEDLLDTFEDLILGYLAKERFDRSTAKDYVDGAVVAKKLGIRFA